MSLQENIGAYINLESQQVGNTGRDVNSGDTAGGTTGTTRNGPQVDLRDDFGKKYHSCKVEASFLLSQLNSGRTVTQTLTLQHRTSTSGAGSTFANVGAAIGTADTFVVTGATDGTTGLQHREVSFNLRTANRYIRTQILHVFNDTATGSRAQLGDTVIAFGGADVNPAT